MRLIDADSMKKSFETDCKEISDFMIDLIDSQPTAYDVDKVNNQLENKMFSAELYGDEWDGQTVNNLLCMGDVYEIVKGGGKDEWD